MSSFMHFPICATYCTLSAIAICLSTLFLKQHSVWDVLAGAALSAAAYPLVYRRKKG